MAAEPCDSAAIGCRVCIGLFFCLSAIGTWPVGEESCRPRVIDGLSIRDAHFACVSQPCLAKGRRTVARFRLLRARHAVDTKSCFGRSIADFSVVSETEAKRNTDSCSLDRDLRVWDIEIT